MTSSVGGTVVPQPLRGSRDGAATHTRRPILRRVDPSTVVVWMAFSEPAELLVRVWEG